MKKKLLTLDDLHLFCKNNGFSHFNSKENGYQIVVQTPATFQAMENKKDELTLYTKIKMFHIGKNRNGSNVTEEAATNCLSGIKYKPILANFCEVDGVKDFTSHDMTFSDDGEIEYIEKQVGCFTADEAWIEYDEEQDKKYVYAYAAIPREYTPTAEIIERKNGTKVSVELCINSFSYSIEEDCLLLEDIEVSGCTLLGLDPETGDKVEEGMKGAKADIVDLADFSFNKNTTKFNVEPKMIEVLDSLKDVLSIFYTQNSQKGGKQQVNKLQELLAKYNVSVDELTFETDGLSDEDLEKVFKETYETEKVEDTEGEITGTEKEVEGTETETPTETHGVPEVEETFETETETEETSEAFSLLSAKEIYKKLFEASFNEIMDALYDLVNTTYSDDDTWYGVEVYENKVVMTDYYNKKFYTQGYKEENGVYSLIGDRVEIFQVYLTAEEKTALDEMKASYSAVLEELESYKAEKDMVEKNAILQDEAYEEFISTEEFSELVKDITKYSVEEFRNKCDLTYAQLIKNQRSTNKTSRGQVNFAAFNIPVGGKASKTEEKKPYGDLFD